jgi:hypothetical protein
MTESIPLEIFISPTQPAVRAQAKRLYLNRQAHSP